MFEEHGFDGRMALKERDELDAAVAGEAREADRIFIHSCEYIYHTSGLVLSHGLCWLNIHPRPSRESGGPGCLYFPVNLPARSDVGNKQNLFVDNNEKYPIRAYPCRPFVTAN